MDYILIEDAKSVFHVLYDKQGARVSIVTLHDDVAIVQNVSGNRFPINQNKLLPIIGNVCQNVSATSVKER